MYEKSYKELIKLPTFEERFRYLKLDGFVGDTTFGYSRYLNQSFYKSKEWQQVRQKVLLRDNACDLGVEGHQINKYALIHHINPITREDILERRPCVLDMNNLITVTKRTHNAIHFGDESQACYEVVDRKPNDTCLWRT